MTGSSKTPQCTSREPMHLCSCSMSQLTSWASPSASCQLVLCDLSLYESQPRPV